MSVEEPSRFLYVSRNGAAIFPLIDQWERRGSGLCRGCKATPLGAPPSDPWSTRDRINTRGRGPRLYPRSIASRAAEQWWGKGNQARILRTLRTAECAKPPLLAHCSGSIESVPLPLILYLYKFSSLALALHPCCATMMAKGAKLSSARLNSLSFSVSVALSSLGYNSYLAKLDRSCSLIRMAASGWWRK